MDVIQGCRALGLGGPRLEELIDDEGPLYRVTYAGMTREHRQEWQAMVWLHEAQSMYSQKLYSAELSAP